MSANVAITGNVTVPHPAVILPAAGTTVLLPPNISAPRRAAAFTPSDNGFTGSANTTALKK